MGIKRNESNEGKIKRIAKKTKEKWEGTIKNKGKEWE
jgi:hypothetical protein